MKTTGLYAGSFDPLTNGHLWLICQGSRLFDRLIIGVGTNAAKQALFTLDERVGFLREALEKYSNITVEAFPSAYTVDFAKDKGVTHLLRGVRSAEDLAGERTIQLMNDDIAASRGIEAPANIIMMPPRALAELSSSMVKALIGPRGGTFENWQPVVERYVPPGVLAGLIEKYEA